MPNTDGASGRSAALVAAGILFSRLSGLVRESVFAHYFGNSDAADAFRQALRIPNVLQNLFGEGVLSASFIPVYANLLARNEPQAAASVAGAVAGLLGAVSSVLVLLGVLSASWLVDVIAPGFTGQKREFTIQLVRILFPGAGLLALSAWCLGILNSHRRFFLSYAAPVVWNTAIIGAMLLWGPKSGQSELAVIVAWGAVFGSFLQFAIQVPVVLRLLPALRLSFATGNDAVKTVVRNFFPVFLSRGVVQISAFVDSVLASLLPTGAVAALAYAQTLYTLPVSLFGMSVSATELTAMSSTVGDADEVAGRLRQRLNAGLRRIAFFVVPSAMLFLALGDIVAAAIFQSGRFKSADAVYVWRILAGSSIGLLASTLGRLYSSTYYALGDTRTPLRYAIIRVVLTSVLGYVAAIPLPVMLGVDQRWGVVGLTASAGISGWLEFALLRRSLNLRIGSTGLPFRLTATLWLSALLAAAAGWGMKIGIPVTQPLLKALAILPVYGCIYLVLTAVFGVPETRSLVAKIRRFR